MTAAKRASNLLWRQLYAAALMGIAFNAPAAHAQGSSAEVNYPTHAVRLIVAFPPGAGADLTARTIAQKMTESMGQAVVVENRPGANGSVAASVVAKAPPDGYTLLLIDRGGLGINPSLYKDPLYDPLKDFAYVSIATWGPYVLVTSTGLPAQSFKEFIQLARSKPGMLNYASYGVGSMAQLNIEALKSNLGVAITHVPYKGGAPAAMAVVTKEADMTIATAPGVLGFIRDGKMRALAIGSTKRSPLLPEVPTVTEVGLSDDILLPTYFGIAAPAKTPPAIIAKLNAEIKRALAMPDVVERLNSAGLEAHGGSPDEMLQTVRSDVVRFGKLVKAIGIEPE